MASLLTIGCSGDTQRFDEASPTNQATLATLTPEEVDRLKREYPRLTEEPLPPPAVDASAPAPPPADVAGELPARVLKRVTGGATYYADKFEGRRTASGIPFRQNQMVAAHRHFPFGTILRVTNLRNDRAVNVRVVDRGPFGTNASKGAILDLSRRAADELDFVSDGKARVRVDVLKWGEGLGSRG